MKNIKIKISRSYGNLPEIVIDGKVRQAKKNKYEGGYDVIHQTDKDKLEIGLYKYQEINGRLWFLVYLFYFIISVFGIFDLPFGRKIISLECKFIIDVSSLGDNSTIDIVMISNGKEGKVAQLATKCEYEEVVNQCFIDAKAKRRIKIYRIFKVLFWVSAIITGIVLLIVK